MNDLITVIVPIYNTSKYLDKCINSIIKQTYENIDIILINDGSNDNSQEICEKYQKKDKRIRLINQKNKGVSKARNKGLELSKGKYISFIDADDFIEQNMLEKMYENISKTQSDVTVCGYDFYKNGKYKFIKEKNYTLEKEKKYEGIFNFSVCNKLYKKEILENIKFDNKKIAEDIAFNFKVFQKINKISFILETPLYHYRIRKESASNTYNENHLEVLEINKIIDFFKEKNMKDLQYKAEVYRLINFGEVIYNLDKTKYKKYYKLFKEYQKEIEIKSLQNKDNIKVILFKHFPKLYLKMRNY